MPTDDELPALQAFLDAHPRLFVLTGAGVSIASGIPGYRDLDGAWQRPPPVQYRDYLDHAHTRRRFWARSLAGWRWFSQARPNAGHTALAAWEAAGRISQLTTQNVDRLHQAAGSRKVIDLHGRLDQVVCLDCGTHHARAAIQHRLVELNPACEAGPATIAPDGDAELDTAGLDDFAVPDCPSCGGLLKPDVVFFGEQIPHARVEGAVQALLEADALLVIGSSLMVYSGYRFCRLAAEHRIPSAAINLGRTRADDLLGLKVSARFEDLIDRLDVTAGPGPG
ncbi:MAG: NAD-dependent protein deacetylase [Gammaproteobacteria bacterium]|nr:NAD-dependent protein deacetylase [Gammaproteobacteria bacterium]